MKKITNLLIIILVFVIELNYGQTPQSMSYQAVARDSAGNAVSNQAIGLRFTIRDVSSSGPIVYRETQSAITNPLGLFSVSIGAGRIGLVVLARSATSPAFTRALAECRHLRTIWHAHAPDPRRRPVVAGHCAAVGVHL